MVSTRGRTRVTEMEGDTTTSRHTRTRTTSDATSRSSETDVHAGSVGDAEDSDDEGSDWEASKHQRKRTKRTHKKVATRGTFGLKFQSVLTLPFDIQLEIFSWLAPKDLISIARINKEFRQTLMQRNATRIWKLARQSQEVPEPPATMSEPQWAVLLFDGSRCSECGTNNVHHIDFGIMKRACVSCRKFNLVCLKKFRKEYSEYDEILLEMIPHTHYGGWAHGRRSNGTFYWLQDIHDIAKTWATHQDAIHRRVPGSKQRADAFHEAKKAVVKSLHDGVQEYTKWYRGVLWNRACAGDDKLRSRHDEIYKRFADMGYAYVDVDTMRYSQEVCQRRPLTERIWKRIQPILETSIRANRQLRIVRFRKDTFQQVFEVYLRSRHPREWPDHLDTQQAAEIPTISSLLNAEWDVQVSREDLQALLTPEAMAAWAGRRKSELISGVAEFHSSGRMEAYDDTRGESSGNLPQSIHLGDPHTDSDLATSIFACSCCNGSLCRSGRQLKNIWFGWQAALRHTCLRPRLPISARDGPGRMTFEPAAYAMAVTLVTEAGLQPETASVEDMDNTGARWFCTSTQACRLSNEIAFDWKSAVAHAMSGAHYDAPAVYKKLPEYQLQYIEFPFPSSFPQKWGCGHCDVHFFTGDNHDRVSAHLKDVHQIEDPAEGNDIIRFHERLSFQPLPLELCKVPPEPEQSTHAS